MTFDPDEGNSCCECHAPIRRDHDDTCPHGYTLCGECCLTEHEGLVA